MSVGSGAGAISPRAIALIAVLLTVLGQLLLKLGVRQVGAVDLGRLPTMLPQIFGNPRIFAGFVIYGLSSVLWVSALSKLDLGYAYPFISLGIVLVFLMSWLILHEPQPTNRIFGSIVIVVGLLIMA